MKYTISQTVIIGLMVVQLSNVFHSQTATTFQYQGFSLDSGNSIPDTDKDSSIIGSIKTFSQSGCKFVMDNTVNI